MKTTTSQHFFQRTLLGLTALFIFAGSLFAEEAQQFTADRERIIRTVRFLSEEVFPRTTCPANKEKTIEFIINSIATAGLEATRGEFMIRQILGDDEIAIELNSYTYTNIHALHKGKTDRRIIVSAHYDALAHTPGADDNASGVAVLIELAHFLNRTPKLNLDIELVFYDLEEDGLLGSWYHARKLRTRGVDVVAMLNLDMVGYFSDAPNSQRYPVANMGSIVGTRGDFLAVFGRTEDAPLMLKANRVFQEKTSVRIAAVPMGRGWEFLLSFSDHAPFWREGYPALLFTDTADFRNRHYHRATDTWDTLDYDRLVQVPVGIYHLILAIDAANAPQDENRRAMAE